MLIDWFTVIAQLINFLVLVWLLKRFLYRPILDAIDAREKHIADELADADEKRVEAEQQRALFQQKNVEFDNYAATNMAQATAEAKIEKIRLLGLVRHEADALRNKLELALKQEQLSLQGSLSERAQKEVFLIVRKTLNDLAETSLESSMAIVFAQRLADLKEEEKDTLKNAFKEVNQPLIVHTAFELPKEQSELVKKALHAIVGDSVEIQFAIEPTLISGIEINTNGQKIGWSIAEYLTTLTQHVNEVLESRNEAQNLDYSSEKDQNKETVS
ncbi:ATP synthase subunit B [Marinomonas ushuaiensis DSM 15871]|uniref:ATP synthase subunit b n=1 Tax=Marinomonas ushuaiensis DSM 15871 TaxID=1122207 RepID=X7E7J9_9GAMM|nr:F0F1 ATP synthase subunit delta [Marinomonas ushuaiensis]ETX11835.1 ATP synthase subunit B [Marinomonas ushuaiensis DSM 15871]